METPTSPQETKKDSASRAPAVARSEIPVPKEFIEAAEALYKEGFRAGWQEGWEAGFVQYLDNQPEP